MPLVTQILRGGEPVELTWTDFHVAAMALASSFEAGDNNFNSPHDIYTGLDGLCHSPWVRPFDCYPDAAFPVTGQLAFMLCTYHMIARTPMADRYDRGYTLTRKHKFLDLDNGEVLALLPGDVLIAFRES